MRVTYRPKKWRPEFELDFSIRHLFTLLHIVEPVENLTLQIVKGGRIQFAGGEPVLAAFCCPDNEIVLPAYGKDPLSSLMHEYQHAIDQRNGIDRKDHRGFPQLLNKLFRKLMEET